MNKLNSIDLKTLIASDKRPILVLNSELSIIETNGFGAGVFNYSQSELINKKANEILDSLLVHEIQNCFRESNRNETIPWSLEQDSYIGIQKDNFSIELEVILTSISDSEEKYIILVLKDISFKSKQNELLTLTQEVARIGSWQVDLLTNKCRWSKVTYEIHELEIGSEILMEEAINFYAPEHQPIIKASIDNAIALKTKWDLELQIVTTTGKKLWVHAIGSPVLENDTLIGLEGTFQDINDRKILELERELILEKLSKTEQITNSCSWEWDLYSEKFSCSDRWYTIHGVDKNEELTLEVLKNLVHPESHKEVEKTIKEVIEKQVASEVEYRIINNKEKDNRFLKCLAQPELDLNGKLVKMVGVIQDITSKKKQELEKNILHRRLELAIGASKFGVWEWDIKNNNLIWDEQMYKIYGVDKKDFNGAYSAWEQGLYPPDKDESTDHLQKALAGEVKFDTSFRIVWPNGELREVRGVGDVYFNSKGEAESMIGINWDITDLSTQAKELKNSNERFALISEGSSVGIWDWRAEGNEEYWSPRFYELLGYDNKEIKASGENFKELLHPADHERTFSLVDEHFETNKPFDIEYRIKHKSGDYRWFRGTGIALRDANGVPVRMVGSIEDINQRILAQEALKISNDELDQFAYIASHDLREPLRGMRNFADFLIEDYSEKLDGEGIQFLHTIKKLGARLDSYLDSLLYYSRLGRSELAYQDTDLNSLIDDVKLSHVNPAEKNIEFVVQKDLPIIKCDSVKLTIILGNLFQNAIRYNTSEIKKIKIKYKKKRNKKHQFWVSDNGIGMKKDSWPRIFTIFQRLHSKEAFEGGTGLGLSLAQKSVEKHGGELWVEKSKEGKGTTFSFVITEK